MRSSALPLRGSKVTPGERARDSPRNSAMIGRFVLQRPPLLGRQPASRLDNDEFAPIG